MMSIIQVPSSFWYLQAQLLVDVRCGVFLQEIFTFPSSYSGYRHKDFVASGSDAVRGQTLTHSPVGSSYMPNRPHRVL